MDELPSNAELAASIRREVERLTVENIKLATALRYYADTRQDGGAIARAALGIPCSQV